MPHTIIDIHEPLTIPPAHLVWGLVTGAEDLKTNSIALKELSKVNTTLSKGNMLFEGSGASFVTAFGIGFITSWRKTGPFSTGIPTRGTPSKTRTFPSTPSSPTPRGATWKGCTRPSSFSPNA